MKLLYPFFRIFVFLLVTMLCFIAASEAQTFTKPRTADDTMAMLKTATPQERARYQTDMLNARAPLSKEQYQKVYAITTKYAMKMDPIMKSDKNKFSKYNQVKTLISDRDDELKPVLSKDQWAKYEVLKDELMARAKKYKDSH